MEHFIAIITKADNIPIVGMLVAVLFFTWLSVSEGLKNDRLTKKGKKEEIARRMRE